jgi:hypothetical protein
MFLHLNRLQNQAFLSFQGLLCFNSLALPMLPMLRLKTRRSVAGLVLCLAGGAVAHRPKIQAAVAASSTETEFIAAVHAAKVAKHLRSVLAELGLPQAGATILCEDNQAAIFMVNERKPAPRVRRVDTQCFATQVQPCLSPIPFSSSFRKNRLSCFLTTAFCRSSVSVNVLVIDHLSLSEEELSSRNIHVSSFEIVSTMSATGLLKREAAPHLAMIARSFRNHQQVAEAFLAGKGLVRNAFFQKVWTKAITSR